MTDAPSFTCPKCGGHYFGVHDATADEWIVECHTPKCRWRGKYDEHVRNEHLEGEMSELKTPEEVDAIMATIPESWRNRWCLSIDNGGCACLGCVQIGNRFVMADKALGRKYLGDPELILESRIRPDIYSKYKISHAEWEAWKERQVQDE